jgi:hypothetical protein
MKKNRYILCLLIGALLLYVAVPRFSIFAEGLEGVFTMTWLTLALLVIAGNLTAMLYAPKSKVQKRKSFRQNQRKIRSYGQ